MRGDRVARRGTGANRRRLRRVEAGRASPQGDRDAAASPCSGNDCALQISAHGAVRGGLAENADGQDPALSATISLLIDSVFPRCRLWRSSLVDLALREASCAGVTLHDRLTLGMAEYALDGLKACRGEFLDFVDHTLRAPFAVEAHNLRGLWKAVAFVLMQRLHRVVGLPKPVGERTRIEDRLRGAVRANRVHRMSGVAEQRDAAIAPMRQWVPVAHGIFPADRSRADQRFDVDAWNVEAPGVMNHLAHASISRPGIDGRGWDLPVGDARNDRPVGEAFVRRRSRRDWIERDLGTHAARNIHRAARQELRPFRGAPPEHQPLP